MLPFEWNYFSFIYVQEYLAKCNLSLTVYLQIFMRIFSQITSSEYGIIDYQENSACKKPDFSALCTRQVPCIGEDFFA